jgi:hypothetical protein
MGSSSCYADALRREVEHAPIKQTASEEARQAAQQLREEMIEPELVVATMNQGRFAAIHNTKATLGESLLDGFTRSKLGFLLLVELLKVKIDEDKVKKEMEQVEKIVVIAYFMEGQQAPKVLLDWLADLGKEIQEELKLGMDLGHVFFQIICKGEAAAQKVLMRTPYHSKWGTSIMQPWCAGFNPRT